MAKLEKRLCGDFDAILARLDEGILSGSMSATLEEQSDFELNGVRCAVRVYERYSWTGGNRLSMTLTLFGSGSELNLSAITSGGSNAVFFKMNTIGEDAFLDTIQGLINDLSNQVQQEDSLKSQRF